MEARARRVIVIYIKVWTIYNWKFKFFRGSFTIPTLLTVTLIRPFLNMNPLAMYSYSNLGMISLLINSVLKGGVSTFNVKDPHMP